MYDAIFSNDSKWLLTIHGEYGEAGFRILHLINGAWKEVKRDSKNISYATFSKDNQWLIAEYEDNAEAGIRVFHLLNESWIEVKRDFGPLYHSVLSNNSQWFLTIQADEQEKGFRIYQLLNGSMIKAMADTNQICQATFSEDSQWLLTIRGEEGEGGFKIFHLVNGTWQAVIGDTTYTTEGNFSYNNKYLLLKNLEEEDGVDEGQESYRLLQLNNGLWQEVDLGGKRIMEASFSPKGSWLSFTDEDGYTNLLHLINQPKPFWVEKDMVDMIIYSNDEKLISFIEYNSINTINADAPTDFLQTLVLNKIPKEAIYDNRNNLYILVEKAMIVVNPLKNPGTHFSYGDGELKFDYEQVKQWMDTFGPTYLMPLDTEIKKKLEIK
jgi:hypothetical protein